MNKGVLNPVVVPAKLAMVLGAAALLSLAVLGIFRPAAALLGWLVGFAAVGCVPLGALALLAIHGLTGGRWGKMARPALVRAAFGTPVLLAVWWPLLLAAHRIYPWASDPSSAGPGVAASYLNTGFFALRGVVGLGGLSVFALIVSRAPFGVRGASICLLFYAAAINLAAFDWLLSLDPHFSSSAFGVQWILTQLVAALAFAILVSDAPGAETAWSDLAALLLAALLGVLYLILMTFLIYWYGDLPDQAAWYLRRSRHGWLALEVSGLTIGAVLPLAALLFTRVRRTPALLRLVALAALGGVFAEALWLMAPSGGIAALAGCLASLAIGGLLIGVTARRASSPEPGSRRLTDGA